MKSEPIKSLDLEAVLVKGESCGEKVAFRNCDTS